ncbi:ROK family protein [Streptomyces sp. 150FB]|uniref:ROK family protein n=1 Tax=Streptomyces sp. 150FB TaxID=1576605 RepID=UPI00058917AB|nr:ROK family protein [Streptomyces sp. 150FB]KIF77664.1 ROK family protein [Streptomyces sp. 150FB]
MHRATDFPLDGTALEALLTWAEGRSDRSVRARIVRDAAEGVTVSDSARTLGVSRPTVTAWRRRYAAHGLAGLEHQPRSGRPPRIDEADVVANTLAGPPAPHQNWSARSLADHLGLSHTALSRVWHRWRTTPGDLDGPILFPTTPALGCHRPELLAVWTSASGAAAVVLTESDRAGQRHTTPARAEERQTRHASLTVGLRQALRHAAGDGSEEGAGGGRARDAGRPDKAARPDGCSGFDEALRALAEAHPGRDLHIVTWGGDDPDPGRGPGAGTSTGTGTGLGGEQVVRHRPHPAMGWAATVCVIAQLELLHHPHKARRVLDSLTESTRRYAATDSPGPYLWQRPGDGNPPATSSRVAHRAFDQLALGSFNEKLVIESIRVAGALSRVEIAEQTGLTPQAVSRITRNLLTAGFLTEDARRSAGKGKPRVPLRLRPDAACAIGIHVDPEMITQVVVDLCGGVRDRRQLPLTGRRDPAWCIAQMARMAAEAAEAVRPVSGTLLGVGVAAPGPIDVNAGVILDPPLFEGWKEVPLRAELSRELGVPVLLEKDATAAAVGERWLGAAERSGDFVYLYLGAGAGSGAFLNGDIFRGSTGNAGEFGELCALTLGRLTPEGGPQMIPECAPISAVIEKAALAGLVVEGGSAHEAICAAAAAGDERAVNAVREVARVVARGAVGMTDLYDTDLLIVGGPAVPPEIADLYLSEISAAVNRFPVARRVRDVRVAYSTLNDAAAAVGAASTVFHTTFAPRLRTHARFGG